MSAKSQTRKSNAVPIRLEEDVEAEVKELSERTGLPVADLIRRCIHFALPAFVEGNANLLDYGRPARKPKAA